MIEGEPPKNYNPTHSNPNTKSPVCFKKASTEFHNLTYILPNIPSGIFFVFGGLGAQGVDTCTFKQIAFF